MWKDKAGSVRVKSGMPRLSQLPVIAGLPAHKVDDPKLAGVPLKLSFGA